MRQEDRDLTRELIRKIVRIKRLDKIRQHYESLRPGDDGRIRTSLAITGTDTGRFSSRSFWLEKSDNLQNKPKLAAKYDPLFEVRDVLGSTPGTMFCAADLSSAERRMLAYLADEQTAIEWTEYGDEVVEDTSYPYKKFGAQFFSDADDWREVTGPYYNVSKMIVLSLDRGVGWKKLKNQINKQADLTSVTISAQQSKDAVSLFHDLFPGYKEYFGTVKETIRSKGFVRNCMGRKLILFNRMENESSEDAAVREAVSFLAQSITDVLNARTRQMWDEMDPHDLKLLLNVHDEVDYECEPRKWKEVGLKVMGIMEQPIDLTGVIPETPHDSLKIPADVAVSMSSWGETEERI